MYCYQLNDEGSEVAKNCGQALGAESRLVLTASKEKGTSGCHYKELHSANNKSELRSRLLPRATSLELRATGTLMLAM